MSVDNLRDSGVALWLYISAVPVVFGFQYPAKPRSTRPY